MSLSHVSLSAHQQLTSPAVNDCVNVTKLAQHYCSENEMNGCSAWLGSFNIGTPLYSYL